MANEKVNKVVYGNNTLIDLTSDTATEDKVLQGYTFHKADGTQATGTASGGSSKNTQVHQSTTRVASTTYTSANSLTCSKTGTYTVYWSTMRSTTGGTSGSRLYIGGTAYGNADTTTWSNHVQNKEVTGVSITKNDTVEVKARSRSTNYYAYVPLLVIVEE